MKQIYRESLFSTVSFSAIPGLVRFEKALNSADSPIQCVFLRRRMLFCMAFTSKNVSKLQQKLHFSKRNEKTINICSKPFLKIYSKDNFFQEQYIFKTKSSKNLQSLLYHSDLNICQDQCTQGSAGLLKKTYFCTSVCVFVSSQQSKIEFDFQFMKIFKTVKSNFLQNWKVLILFIN